MKIIKNIQSMYQNNVVKKHVDLLLIGGGKTCSYQRFQQIHV